MAQKLAQAVRADEEKQAKRQAARAGAGAQKAEPQAPRADGWGRAQGSPPRTRAGAGNEAQGGAPRAKLSAWGEIAGGVHPRTGAQGGAPYAGPGEWEETPRLHTMELPWPGTGLTGTQPGSMMEETKRRTDLAPGALALLPWPAGPLPKQEGLPRFVDEAPAPGAVPHGAQDGVQLLRAAPQNLQAGLAGSGARAAESPLSGGQMGAARPADEYLPPDYTDPQWWMDWVDSTHEGHPVWEMIDEFPPYQSVLSWVQEDQAKEGKVVKNVLLDLAGHHPIAGKDALASSNKAALGKAVLFPNDPNLNIDGAKPNAFLHAFWNAQMAYRIGPEMAETFATAYEAYRDEEYEAGILDSVDPATGLTTAENIVMDMHNNSVGRSLAAKMPDTPEAVHAELFSRYGSEEAIRQALELCPGFDEADLLLFHYTTEAMDAGQLQWLYE